MTRMGQTLTLIYTPAGQVTTIRDALNRDTTLTDSNTDGLIDRVTDPVGRFATFTYDPQRQLTGITDMGGYATTLTYDSRHNPATLTNPRGTWGFAIEPPDGQPNAVAYPAPGGVMVQNSRITVTNPLGGREEYYYQFTTNRSWYVSPRDYVAYLNAQTNNAAGSVPKTRYGLVFVGNDQRGEFTRVTTPEGVTVNYGYDSAGNRTSVQAGSNPAAAYAYNAMGRVTSVTDPLQKHPATLTYDPANQMDVTAITNGLGTIVLTYNSQHDVTSIRDRLNRLTEFGYDATGQMIWQKDWLTSTQAIPTDYVYDATTRHLTTITRAGQTVAQYTYDAIGRVRTATDATGLTLTSSYNNLNAITKVQYPDGKTEEAVYSGCCPRLVDRTKDRAGRITSYIYDDLKRLTDVQRPDGGVIHYAYDTNGNLRFLTDPENHVTEFTYDRDNRRRTRIYADGNYEEWVYNALGQVDYAYNARRTQKDYSYDANGNLTGVHYSDSTPDVTYTYDMYDRLDARQDGLGLWDYGYDANSDLTSVDGPWPNDMLAYTLDALGRITQVSPQGGTAINYVYDDFNRLTQVQTGAGNFVYGYTGANPLVQTLTRPTGSVTTYSYDGVNRLLALINKNSTGGVLSQHMYTYNAQDLRDSDTVTGSALMLIPTATDASTTYATNALHQLTGTTGPTRTYHYDADGNLTGGYTKDGYPFVATYDAENRMTALTYTGTGNVVFTTAYVYSGDGLLGIERRYENTVLILEMRFLRDGGLVVQDRLGDNRVVNAYTWGLSFGGGIGGLLNLTQAGSNYAYLYDGSGNVEAVLNSAQAVVAAYRYDPFGVRLNQTGSLLQPYGFSTKRYDAALGMIHYEARKYWPAIGTWDSRDPLGEAGGLNLYVFVGNNPVNWVDPWGEEYAELYAGFGSVYGGILAGGISVVLDVGSGSLNVLVSPLELAAGAAVGGLIGYRVGSIVDDVMAWWPVWFPSSSASECDISGPLLIEHTPETHPEEFEPVKGTKAKRNKKTGEIWDPDLLHKDHYEVYKNLKKFEKGNRTRSVWKDGRDKETF
jgi:RHS repeat-associated protein